MNHLHTFIKALGRQRLSIHVGNFRGQAEGLAAVAGMVVLLLIMIL